jgi:hypothetical protein
MLYAIILMTVDIFLYKLNPRRLGHWAHFSGKKNTESSPHRLELFGQIAIYPSDNSCKIDESGGCKPRQSNLSWAWHGRGVDSAKCIVGLLSIRNAYVCFPPDVSSGRPARGDSWRHHQNIFINIWIKIMHPKSSYLQTKIDVIY